jgi:pyruvate dehydrogenase E2 component (dihydrolipoamide acetyltransferase)
MATDVILPALGMSQETGKIVQWLKAEGEQVAKGEPLAEIETDKATVEIEAPASGVLARVTAQPGDEVPVGQPVAIILATGEEPPARQGAGATVAATTAAATAGSFEAVGEEPPAEHTAAAAGSFEARMAPASPLARRLAQERGVDVASVVGTGPGGAVKAGNLPGEDTQRVRAASGIWATMARRTTESWTTVPHFYLEREVDASRLQSWRLHAKRANPAVTVTDLLVRLAAACLRHHPLLNGRWDGEQPVAALEVGIGIAVAVDDGLVVPVIKEADRLSLAEITAGRADLAERARAGRLRPDELRGATFTISNLGMYAVDTFHAIVDSPQAAILAVGRIADRAVATGGLAQVRPSLRLSLSCDHRAVDGARAARFLTDLGDLVEEPAALL